jgi:hypothetical protein
MSFRPRLKLLDLFYRFSLPPAEIFQHVTRKNIFPPRRKTLNRPIRLGLKWQREKCFAYFMPKKNFSDSLQQFSFFLWTHILCNTRK